MDIGKEAEEPVQFPIPVDPRKREAPVEPSPQVAPAEPQKV